MVNRAYGWNRIFFDREEIKAKMGFLDDTNYGLGSTGGSQLIISPPDRSRDRLYTSRLVVIIRDGNCFVGAAFSQVNPYDPNQEGIT